MSTSLTIRLPSALIPDDVSAADIADHVDATLEAFHPGVSFHVTFGDDPTARADFAVYEDTPGEQPADGLDDIENEADQALADALRELSEDPHS